MKAKIIFSCDTTCIHTWSSTLGYLKYHFFLGGKLLRNMALPNLPVLPAQISHFINLQI